MRLWPEIITKRTTNEFLRLPEVTNQMWWNTGRFFKKIIFICRLCNDFTMTWKTFLTLKAVKITFIYIWTNAMTLYYHVIICIWFWFYDILQSQIVILRQTRFICYEMKTLHFTTYNLSHIQWKSRVSEKVLEKIKTNNPFCAGF